MNSHYLIPYVHKTDPNIWQYLPLRSKTPGSPITCDSAACSPHEPFLEYTNGSDFTYATWMGALYVDTVGDDCFFGTTDDTIQDYSCAGEEELRGLCQFDCRGEDRAERSSLR